MKNVLIKMRNLLLLIVKVTAGILAVSIVQFIDLFFAYIVLTIVLVTLFATIAIVGHYLHGTAFLSMDMHTDTWIISILVIVLCCVIYHIAKKQKLRLSCKEDGANSAK